MGAIRQTMNISSAWVRIVRTATIRTTGRCGALTMTNSRVSSSRDAINEWIVMPVISNPWRKRSSQQQVVIAVTGMTISIVAVLEIDVKSVMSPVDLRTSSFHFDRVTRSTEEIE